VLTRSLLSPDSFAALASGGGGPRTVEALRESRLSRHVLLLRSVAEAWPAEPADLDAAVTVLASAQDRAPERVARILGDPMVGAWVGWTARRIRGHVTTATPLDADLGQLAAVAAVAAVATGGDADLRGYARDGIVPLPGLGAARVPGNGVAPVRITVRGGELTVHDGRAAVTVPAEDLGDAGNSASWLGLRRLRAHAGGMSCDIALDDLDPYRGEHHVPPAERLTEVDADRWQGLFADAWALLTEVAPARAEELASGICTLVPLVTGAPGTARSATTPDAFGALGLTLPGSAADFVVTLVHEFQHSKLSALLDLVQLCDPTDDQTYFAPWRTDPRPIGGVLHGVYAFLGVADMWWSCRARDELREAAVREFADVRVQVHETLTVLEGSGALTPAGRRFAAGMRTTVDAMMAETVPDAAVRQARENLRRTRQTWHTRNCI
jgi:HEXXH motif-containing protein